MKTNLLTLVALACALAFSGCATTATTAPRSPFGEPVVLGEATDYSPSWQPPPARTQAEREEYLRANPRPPAIADAITKGSLVAGMTVSDAGAALGNIYRDSESGGVGGSFDVWYFNPGNATTYLFFLDGRLVRWSKHSNT